MTIQEQDCWTAMPNSLIQRIPELGLAAFGICTVVCRHTIGWHKQEDRISLSQFQQELGITKNTTLTAIKTALELGAISRRTAPDGSYTYRLNDPSNPTSSKIELADSRESGQNGLAEEHEQQSPASAKIELAEVQASAKIELGDLSGGAIFEQVGVQKLNTQKKDQRKISSSSDELLDLSAPPEKKQRRRTNPLDDSKSPESVRAALADICNIDMKHAPKEVKINLYRAAKQIWAMQQERSKSEQQTVQAIGMVVQYMHTNCHPYNSATPQPVTPYAIHKYWDSARVAAGAKSHETAIRPATSAEQRLRDAAAESVASKAALAQTGSASNRAVFTEATADW